MTKPTAHAQPGCDTFEITEYRVVREATITTAVTML